jgi:CheY-like chemotaxis protein
MFVQLAAQILIVDDDPDIRETLSELLQAEGYGCATASNGRDALEYLSSQPFPALILLDLMMPVMDGFEFRAAQLEADALRDLPVLVISAGGRAAQAAKALRAADYLDKPMDIGDLFRKVRACIPGSEVEPLAR